MPYQLETRDHMVIMHYTGNISEEEAIEIEQVLNAALDAAAPPLHYIVDIEDLIGFPTAMLLRRENISYLQHPNLGYTVIYGNNSAIVRVVSNVIKRIIPFRYQFVDNLQAALDFVAALNK